MGDLDLVQNSSCKQHASCIFLQSKDLDHSTLPLTSRHSGIQFPFLDGIVLRPSVEELGSLQPWAAFLGSQVQTGHSNAPPANSGWFLSHTWCTRSPKSHHTDPCHSPWFASGSPHHFFQSVAASLQWRTSVDLASDVYASRLHLPHSVADLCWLAPWGELPCTLCSKEISMAHTSGRLMGQ